MLVLRSKSFQRIGHSLETYLEQVFYESILVLFLSVNDNSIVEMLSFNKLA